jgi:long-chain acyl-CoA synthetase
MINAMYHDKEEVQVVASVTYRDGRKGTVTTSVKIRTVGKGVN